jgi:hypothetical protein
MPEGLPMFFPVYCQIVAISNNGRHFERMPLLNSEKGNKL